MEKIREAVRGFIIDADAGAKKKMWYLFTLLLFTGVAVGEIVDKLAIGGRWGTGQIIGMADRFLHGQGLYYATPDFSALEVSSTYFPGTVYIALIFRILFGKNCETALIIASWLFVSAFVVLLAYLTHKMIEKRFTLNVLIILSMVFLTTGFNTLRFYMGEWHPDFMVVFSAAIAVISLDKLLNIEKKYKLILVFLFCFWMIACALYKQTGLAFYIGFALYILFSRVLSIKDKVRSGVLMFISGIIVLLIIFTFTGCYETTVKLNAGHALLPEIFKDGIVSSIKECKYFIAILFFFYILLFLKKIKLNNFIAKAWFCGSHCWTLMSLYGAFKDGANEGNVESGIISLMPFVLYTVCWLVNFFKNRYQISHRDLVNYFSIFFVVATIAIATNYSSIVGDFKAYQKRIVSQASMNEYLSENYEGKNIAYFCSYYSWLCDSRAIPSTDFNLSLCYMMAGLFKDSDYEKLHEKEQWPLLIQVSTLDIPDGLKPFYRKLDENKKPTFASYFDMYVPMQN